MCEEHRGVRKRGVWIKKQCKKVPVTRIGFGETSRVGTSGGSVVKNPTASAGDVGSILGSGRSPGERNSTHSSILAWRIPWTEEPCRLQSMGSQSIRHNLATKQQPPCY